MQGETDLSCFEKIDKDDDLCDYMCNIDLYCCCVIACLEMLPTASIFRSSGIYIHFTVNFNFNRLYTVGATMHTVKYI